MADLSSEKIQCSETGFILWVSSYQEFCNCNNHWQFGLKYFLSVFFLKRLHGINTSLFFFSFKWIKIHSLCGKICNRLDITGEATEGYGTGSSNHSFEMKIPIGKAC